MAAAPGSQEELVRALQAEAEQSVSELTGAQNKLSAEVAELGAATANMSSIDEALQLDEVQQNKLVLQVSQQQQEMVSSGLEELRQECSCQVHTLAELLIEKLLLVREKACLEVKLRAAEWDRQGLAEQLAEAR
ncbi:centrosome-associated protein CEP250-like [Phaenicophaeus curvirostris]|uniref:centrosome-associated protein CEP250-like n=1 Tax=Phaenicophaeus curvirostris TaxID=33595 RepID=UPI0037F0CBB6